MTTIFGGGKRQFAGLTLTDSIETPSNALQISNGLIVKSTTGCAISGATTLTSKDSGGIFYVAKTSAYAISLPTPEQGMKFKFVIQDAGAFAVTISTGSADLVGIINDAGTLLNVLADTTITLVATGNVGDYICIDCIDADNVLVSGACMTTNKITVA